MLDEGTVVFEPGGSGFVLNDGAMVRKRARYRHILGEPSIEGRHLTPTFRVAMARPGSRSWHSSSRPRAAGKLRGAFEASLMFVTPVQRVGNGRTGSRTPRRDAPVPCMYVGTKGSDPRPRTWPRERAPPKSPPGPARDSDQVGTPTPARWRRDGPSSAQRRSPGRRRRRPAGLRCHP